MNCLCAWAFIGIFELGYSAVLGFMLIVFFPMIIQLIFSFVFLFLAVPMRYLGLRKDKAPHYGVEMSPGDNMSDTGSQNPMTKSGSGGRLVDVETGEPARSGAGNLRVDTTWSDAGEERAPQSLSPLPPLQSSQQPAQQKAVTFQRGL
jgi:hypothetical protein